MRIRAIDAQEVNRWMRGLVFTEYYRLTGRRSVLEAVDRLEEQHRWPRPEIDSYVRQSLCRLLAHAAQTVPYYRDLMDGEIPDETTALSLLQKLPVLTKEIIRTETPRLLSERPGTALRWNQSSGSTGAPIRLMQDAAMKGTSRANKLLFKRWAGHRTGEPHLMIWGVPIGKKISRRERLYRIVHREIHLDCNRIDEGLLRRWVDRINAVRPASIEGYADAIHELALYALAHGLELASPRGIVASAAVLTPHMRATIEKAFRCPVLNRYGSREVSDMACSCPSSTELHLSEFTCYLEIVDERGEPCASGVEGDILVTPLTNLTMPLIRYRIEDRGVWASGPCPCGRNTLRLAQIREIRRYQFRRARRDRVAFIVVPVRGVSDEVVKQQAARSIEPLKSLLKGVPVELTVAADIPPGKSGKHRYVINELTTA